MKKAIVVAVVCISVWFGVFISRAQQKEPNARAKQMQDTFTDPAIFRSGLVQAIRESETHDAEHEAHHKKLFEADGPWGKILAEKDAVLTEALGPAYKNHKNISMFEVEVLYNLGKLDMIRNFESFQKIRAGNPYQK